MTNQVSQIAVNETARLIARMETMVEDMQTALSAIVMETDASMARLQGRPTVKCPRCRVTVDVDKLDLPGRCIDHRCPLSKENRGKNDT